jgi:hypothetical protein
MTARRALRPASLIAAALALASCAIVAACGWDPTKPFEREAPEVKQAMTHLDGGDASTASELLEDYLTTGACKEGSIGTPPRVRERPNGSFDLGLGLFKIAEAYGKRFGEEEEGDGERHGVMPPGKESRADHVACALRVVRAVAEDASQPVDLRARARYLEGNLLFLNGAYEDAVRAYDEALERAPGMPDAGVEAGPRALSADPVGRDAAWNRAIALRRLEDKKDAGKDAQNDANDKDSGGDGGGDSNKDDKDKDKNKDGGGGDDGGGKDSGSPNDPQKPPQPQPNEPQPQPSSRQNQDERMLDQLENAPTVQQQAAMKSGTKRRVRGMADK